MSSNITLYSWPTPNGVKASITLEELGLSYKAEGLDISSSSNPQKEEYTSPPPRRKTCHNILTQGIG
jgi:glutathione S-transferase